MESIQLDVNYQTSNGDSQYQPGVKINCALIEDVIIKEICRTVGCLPSEISMIINVSSVTMIY